MTALEHLHNIASHLASIFPDRESPDQSADTHNESADARVDDDLLAKCLKECEELKDKITIGKSLDDAMLQAFLKILDVIKERVLDKKCLDDHTPYKKLTDFLQPFLLLCSILLASNLKQPPVSERMILGNLTSNNKLLVDFFRSFIAVASNSYLVSKCIGATFLTVNNETPIEQQKVIYEDSLKIFAGFMTPVCSLLKSIKVLPDKRVTPFESLMVLLGDELSTLFKIIDNCSIVISGQLPRSRKNSAESDKEGHDNSNSPMSETQLNHYTGKKERLLEETLLGMMTQLDDWEACWDQLEHNADDKNKKLFASIIASRLASLYSFSIKNTFRFEESPWVRESSSETALLFTNILKLLHSREALIQEIAKLPYAANSKHDRSFLRKVMEEITDPQQNDVNRHLGITPAEKQNIRKLFNSAERKAKTEAQKEEKSQKATEKLKALITKFSQIIYIEGSDTPLCTTQQEFSDLLKELSLRKDKTTAEILEGHNPGRIKKGLERYNLDWLLANTQAIPRQYKPDKLIAAEKTRSMEEAFRNGLKKILVSGDAFSVEFTSGKPVVSFTNTTTETLILQYAIYRESIEIEVSDFQAKLSQSLANHNIADNAHHFWECFFKDYWPHLFQSDGSSTKVMAAECDPDPITPQAAGTSVESADADIREHALLREIDQLINQLKNQENNFYFINSGTKGKVEKFRKELETYLREKDIATKIDHFDNLKNKILKALEEIKTFIGQRTAEDEAARCQESESDAEGSDTKGGDDRQYPRLLYDPNATPTGVLQKKTPPDTSRKRKNQRKNHGGQGNHVTSSFFGGTTPAAAARPPKEPAAPQAPAQRKTNKATQKDTTSNLPSNLPSNHCIKQLFSWNFKVELETPSHHQPQQTKA